MIQEAIDNFWYLMDRGGWVMWPLVVLACAAVTLVVERSWFWLWTNHPGRQMRVHQMSKHLLGREQAAARALAESDRSVYGRVVVRVLSKRVDAAVAADAIEAQRPRLERFMPTLSTIITAAPMLGILGTVTGLIHSFNILSHEGVTDPRAVSPAIGEALLTTAVGLGVSIAVLFPYNAYRAQVDRTLNRFEVLMAAAAAEPRPATGAQDDSNGAIAAEPSGSASA